LNYKILSYLLFLGGCSTGYHQSSFLTNGYDDVRIDQNTVQVSFEGNSYTSRHDVAKYTMYHCAQLTLKYGFDYFIFQNESSQTLNSGSTSLGATGKMGLGPGGALPMVLAPFQVGVSGGGMFNSHKSNTLVTIKMFKGQKGDIPLAYDAREVIKCMQEKI
jgi:hypothetical protein